VSGISPSVSDCNSGVGTGSAKGRQRPLSFHGLSGHYGAARIRLDNSPSAAKLCALRAVLWPLLAPALAQTLERLSPTHLFGEAVVAVKFGPIFLDQLEGAVMGTPLPFIQSVLLAWPQTVGLIAATLLFVVGYVTFQRQEVRV